jgi:hypothetical protein
MGREADIDELEQITPRAAAEYPPLPASDLQKQLASRPMATWIPRVCPPRGLLRACISRAALAAGHPHPDLSYNRAGHPA